MAAAIAHAIDVLTDKKTAPPKKPTQIQHKLAPVLLQTHDGFINAPAYDDWLDLHAWEQKTLAETDWTDKPARLAAQRNIRSRWQKFRGGLIASALEDGRVKEGDSKIYKAKKPRAPRKPKVEAAAAAAPAVEATPAPTPSPAPATVVASPEVVDLLSPKPAVKKATKLKLTVKAPMEVALEQAADEAAAKPSKKRARKGSITDAPVRGEYNGAYPGVTYD